MGNMGSIGMAHRPRLDLSASMGLAAIRGIAVHAFSMGNMGPVGMAIGHAHGGLGRIHGSPTLPDQRAR